MRADSANLSLTVAVVFAGGGQVPGDLYGYGVTGPLPSDLQLFFSSEEVFFPCS